MWYKLSFLKDSLLSKQDTVCIGFWATVIKVAKSWHVPFAFWLATAASQENLHMLIGM